MNKFFLKTKAVNVIANPVLWDEAIFKRLPRRPKEGLLAMTITFISKFKLNEF